MRKLTLTLVPAMLSPGVLEAYGVNDIVGLTTAQSLINADSIALFCLGKVPSTNLALFRFLLHSFIRIYLTLNRYAGKVYILD